MSNEIYVGAGTQVTLVPESDIYLGSGATESSKVVTHNNSGIKLVNGLYVGCRLKLEDTSNTIEYHTITANTDTTLTIEATTSLTGNLSATILQFGAPVPAAQISSKETLLSDNWLGLVNTFTPFTVDAEMKQLNLAVSGTRNFSHQFKGAETVSGGSLDISLNNGTWLYYALGTKTFSATQQLNSGNTAVTLALSQENGKVYYDDTNKTFHRYTDNLLNPETSTTDTNMKKMIENGDVEYTFSESNGDDLPSFALDVSYNKASNTDLVVDSTDGTDMYSRVFTGCQVNTFTMSFEESQELKCSMDLVSRRAFDSPVAYAPHRKIQGVGGTTTLFNYNANDNIPYMFSDGTITLFGQNYARVKSGTLTINNNITPQRFVGNTSREIMSAHVPGQRTYELSLSLLITDTKLWSELRQQDEYNDDNGTIKLRFEKDSNDYIEIELDDYIIQSLEVPFPDDKGPIEVSATISARKLTSCKYKGKWIIIG
ncbi:MAG: hypothetical protein GOVbin140_66 [Prokaryotic dsDNA virus sp.]|nr:MAG: hypothetical protein GOVbin140_66 [Prokaryotic dsDNA virus sp.]|tara:strand:- start:27812 stop:29269 length:1458 start_codon:yes stop_codon:yes gene_type:complete